MQWFKGEIKITISVHKGQFGILVFP